MCPDFNIKQAGSNIRFAFRILGGKKVKERDDLNKLADDISSFLTSLDVSCAGNIGNATIESMTRGYIDICIKLKKKLSEIIKSRENVDSKLSHSIQEKNIINEFPAPINSGNFRLFKLDELQTWLGKFLEIQGGHFTAFGGKIIDAVRKLSKVDMYEKLKINLQELIDVFQYDGKNIILNNNQNINNNNQPQNNILENNYIGYELNDDQNKVPCLNCKKLFDKNSITNGNCMECNKKTQELLYQPENGFYGNGLNNNLNYDLPDKNELYNQNINNQSQNYLQNIENSGYYNYNSQDNNQNLNNNIIQDGYEMYNSQNIDNIDNDIIQNYNLPNNNVCSKCGKAFYESELMENGNEGRWCMECIDNAFQNLDDNQQNNILKNSGNNNFQNNILENSEYNLINNNNNNDKNIDDQMVCLICTNPIAAEKTVGFCKNEKCRKTICGECIQQLRNPDQCPFCRQNSGFDLN